MKRLILVMLLILSPPINAEEIADGPYLHMGVVVATMGACAFLAPDDINSDTHCFGAVAETFLLEIIFANTEYQSWAPAVGTCVTSALWEIRDHQGFGVADPKDFGWGCGPAILINYGLGGIFSFYNEKKKRYFADEEKEINIYRIVFRMKF